MINQKAHESEAGALLVKLIFSRLVVDRGVGYGMKRNETGNHVVTPVNSNQLSQGDCTPPLHYVYDLVALLKGSCTIASSNVQEAATTCPGHGLVLAIQRCITECKFKFTPSQGWRECIQELLAVCTHLLDVVLGVLGSDLESDSAAPSFEQMGISVQQAIANCTNDGAVLPESEAVLTCQQQMVLTWCWINIRQISVLLGRTVDCVPLGKDGLIDVVEVRKIAQIFVGVLTGCRHRGAIEGCNVGFMKFCTRLLGCEEDELRKIPGDALAALTNHIL